MAPTGSSWSLFGMVRHHVTALAAIFICILVLTSAQTAPNADSLNLQTSNGAHQQPPSHPDSNNNGHHPLSPPASDGDDDSGDQQQLRLNHPDFENEEEVEEVKEGEQSPSASGGSSQAERETEMTEVKRVAPHASAYSHFQWKRMYGPSSYSSSGRISGDDFSKRFHQGFVGSRGKRKEEGNGNGVEEVEGEEGKRFAPLFNRPGARSPWQGALYGGDGKISTEALAKRMFHQNAFVGSRGKRSVGENNNNIGDVDDEDDEMVMVPVAKRWLPFLLGQQQRQQQPQPQGIERRGFNPYGFTASRGKRYMPGLEALLLSQMYKKMDAEKWKRQSMLGFHAARG